MSALLKALSALTPGQQAPLSGPYDGLEYKWKMFVFRPAQFKFEGTMLAILAVYMALHFIGKAINMGRAKKIMAPYIPTLESQFSLVRPLLSSSSALHLLYATGRRNVLCVHATLKLQPLHDVIGLIVGFVWGIIEPLSEPTENLKFVFTLGRGNSGLQGEGGGVWAVLNKDGMANLRSERFDLTFPRMHESTVVPITHSLFAEHSDITDALLKTATVGITELLQDATAADMLRYLIVTDEPTHKPARGPLKVEQRSREIQLGVRLPSTAAQTEAVQAWIQVALNVADLLARPNLIKPDVMRKLTKARADVDADLARQYKKELAEDAPKEETAEERRAAKKRAERAALSEKELKKLEEKEKKRDFRKMQKRGMGGMK